MSRYVSGVVLLCIALLCSTMPCTAWSALAQERSTPALPPGLSSSPISTTDPPQQSPPADEQAQAHYSLTGFLEGRLGARVYDDTDGQDRVSIGEVRLRMDVEREQATSVMRLAVDLVGDTVASEHSIDLDSGQGALDLREATLRLTPQPWLDVKAGRQVLSWGVGDQLFINDLFPKDYVALVVGRDDNYLKAPSDALRLSLFSDRLNAEFVYTPRFDADRFVTGERLSFYLPGEERLSERGELLLVEARDQWFDEDEVAFRLYGQYGTLEAAVYGYDGYWKTPEGQRSSGVAFHPRLSVVGGSLRGQFGGGVAWAELGRYFSRDDSGGANPLIRNGQTRALAGYERQLTSDVTLSVQYGAELEHDHHRRSPLETGGPDNRLRHLVTSRLSVRLLNERLILSGFLLQSPNEHDGYLRVQLKHTLTDDWHLLAGGNRFFGGEPTPFGQFQNNSNVFLGMRLHY